MRGGNNDVRLDFRSAASRRASEARRIAANIAKLPELLFVAEVPRGRQSE